MITYNCDVTVDHVPELEHFAVYVPLLKIDGKLRTFDYHCSVMLDITPRGQLVGIELIGRPPKGLKV